MNKGPSRSGSGAISASADCLFFCACLSFTSFPSIREKNFCQVKPGTLQESAVRPPDYPDRHFVRAAEGWLELGDSAEAARELRRLTPAAERHPDVLELRWRLHVLTGQWDAALAVARAVTIAAPERLSGWIHQSYCLHELHRTAEALQLLLPTADTFPKESIIPYNLACYTCQLGDLPAARNWLQRAVKLLGRSEIKSMALHDADLAPLHGYIDSL